LVESLPKTSTGKTDLQELKKLAEGNAD